MGGELFVGCGRHYGLDLGLGLGGLSSGIFEYCGVLKRWRYEYYCYRPMFVVERPSYCRCVILWRSVAW